MGCRCGRASCLWLGPCLQGDLFWWMLPRSWNRCCKLDTGIRSLHTSHLWCLHHWSLSSEYNRCSGSLLAWACALNSSRPVSHQYISSLLCVAHIGLWTKTLCCWGLESLSFCFPFWCSRGMLSYLFYRIRVARHLYLLELQLDHCSLWIPRSCFRWTWLSSLSS